MTPPRRPRGEKPATTIRYLRRQIANLQSSLAIMHKRDEHAAKRIAEQDVLLNEARRTQLDLEAANTGIALQRDRAENKLRTNESRLAYLEGYYAKSCLSV